MVENGGKRSGCCDRGGKWRREMGLDNSGGEEGGGGTEGRDRGVVTGVGEWKGENGVW